MVTRKAQKSPILGNRRGDKEPGCRVFPRPIPSLGEFFNICDGVLKKDSEFWFRGHADLAWSLTPSALRYETAEERNTALNLLADFKRYAEIKLPHPPSQDDLLKWVQLARHYGLPTRLLDWTKNAAIALYFACQKPRYQADANGAVLILNPKDLNRESDRNPRVFDAHLDAPLIAKYLNLSGERKPRGPRTIAINPVWNSERIMLQQGTFTLHGSREFALTGEQVPSLICLRVPTENKEKLLYELEQAGINEMSIFPEPEHMCRYLIWRERLKE